MQLRSYKHITIWLDVKGQYYISLKFEVCQMHYHLICYYVFFYKVQHLNTNFCKVISQFFKCLFQMLHTQMGNFLTFFLCFNKNQNYSSMSQSPMSYKVGNHGKYFIQLRLQLTQNHLILRSVDHVFYRLKNYKIYTREKM